MTSAADLYADAGVDVAAGERAVDLMRASIATTARPELIGGIGGFAGLFDASALKSYRHPVLATSTDGVGTKVAVASAMGVFDTVGHDLIGMLVDDLVVCGAEPVYVTDYIACGKVVPERIAAIVAGVADGCRLAGAALVGGETAEHSGLMGPDEFDLAGATTGFVEADELLGPDRVRAGDVVIAMESSGLHSNGYSLVRKVFLADAGWALDRHVDEFGRTLGEELLEPTRIYALDVLALISGARTFGAQPDGTDGVHAFSHVTGGGLANNLARVVPAGLTAVIDRSTWHPGAVFDVMAGVAKIDLTALEGTVNLGVGMLAMLPATIAEDVVSLLAARGVRAGVCGTIEAVPDAHAPGTASMVNSYA